MAISRMFSVMCDKCTETCSGEYFKSSAIETAIAQGWQVNTNGTKALCPNCRA